MVAAFKVPTSVVSSGTAYEADLDGDVTVGQLARYLSAMEPAIETSTLEMASPVPAARRLHWLNWQSGDRLAIFVHPPRRGEFPVPLRQGDRLVRFTAGGLSLASGGKQMLTVGKPDSVQGDAPDIDLRHLLPPGALDYISRNCLRLTYDSGQQTWFAERTGNTRVLLDELELDRHPAPLNATQHMRFFRASDEPGRPGTQPLGAVEVSVEIVSADRDADALRPGSKPVAVTVGMESDPALVRASESIQIDQIVTRLMDYQRLAGGETGTDVYSLRLLPPDVALGDLSFNEGAFLYAAQTRESDLSVLRLIDVHDRGRVYAVTAERADRVVRLGWRADGQPAGSMTDLDLQESVVGQAMLPFDVAALIRYRASEGMWWVDPGGQSGSAIFVNSTRLMGSPLPLTTGDVLSFGMSVTHYFARFEVDIATRRA